MAPSNFNCDSCKQGIAASNPRIHCLVCPDYDLCGNCHLGERFSDGHQGQHRTQVYKQSGGNGQAPIAATDYGSNAPPPTAYPEAPRQSTTPVPPPRGAPAPPNLPPRRGNGQGTSPPTMPTPSQQPAAKWGPFYYPDASPTPLFINLMNDIFSYLDSGNVGNLVPEVISRFLDDMGYALHENAWKMALKPSMNLSAESMADKSLKSIYDLFSIEHVLLKRQQRPHVDPTGITAQFSRLLGSSFNPSMLSDPSSMEGPMPAITRNGFIELRKIDGLHDPSKEWGNLSRLLRKYNLPKYAGWGDLPRSVLPDVADPGMLKRVADITAYAQRKGQEELAAARASAQIAAQGRQAAVDLIDGTRREYRYTYY